MKRIPTRTDYAANTLRRVTFEDRLLAIKFLWDEFAGSFFLTLEDGLGGSVHGIRMVENLPLLAQNKGFIDFSGDLLVLKSGSDTGPLITYENFGNGWDPYLLTSDEVDTWRAENGL